MLQKANRYRLVSLLIWLFLTPVVYADPTVAIGQVLLSSGKVTATQADNTVRELKRGSPFFTQDTIVTEDKSQVQIRFSDGTLVVLRPKSTFKISEYQYAQPKKDEKTDKSVLKYTTQLMAGGLRTITGSIAKEDPEDYKINTTVATIGVRGTEFSIVLSKNCSPAKKVVKCALSAMMYEGRIFMQNQKGILDIGEGAQFKYAIIRSEKNLPKGLTTKPAEFRTDVNIVPIAPLTPIPGAAPEAPSVAPPAEQPPTAAATSTTTLETGDTTTLGPTISPSDICLQ